MTAPPDALTLAREARFSRALAEGDGMTWSQTPAGWLCETASGGRYLVRDGACSCPDFSYRGRFTITPCKHLLAFAVRQVRKAIR